MDPVSLVLGVAALTVSGWAVIESRRTASAQTRLQERLLTLESARERDRLLDARRAQLRAEITHAGLDYRLVVRNVGNAEARAVRVYVDDRPLSDHAIIVLSQDEEVSIFGPGVDVRYIMRIAIGSSRRYDVRIEWEDDSGEPGLWRSQLRI
jgi:hypothetical protein